MVKRSLKNLLLNILIPLERNLSDLDSRRKCNYDCSDSGSHRKREDKRR
jgi:hypothetical protein